MDIQLKASENKELFIIDDILEEDASEGIYLSTLDEMRDDYTMIAVIRDCMGDCIGLAKSGDSSYVFNDVGNSTEFQGEFYKSDSGISIDP